MQRLQHHATNPWIILVLVCLAQFMVVLDATIVNVALPSIQQDLHFSNANLQWVVNAYTLMFGGFLLLGGRAADLFGRQRLFLMGIAVFTGASLMNGFASSSEMLIVGRGLQGLGAALVSPAALSIVTTTFAEGPQRTKALGVWAAIAVGGSAFGLLLGGALTEFLSWQWVFFVNIPVGIIAMFLSWKMIPNTKGSAHGTVDWWGAVAVTGGLTVLVYTIVKASGWGWTSTSTIIGFAASAILLIVFWAIERQIQHPLVRLSIFRRQTLTVANISMLFVAAGMFSMFYFVSIYVQKILGYQPFKAGLAFLPVTCAIIFGAGMSQQLIRKIGVRTVPLIGLALTTVGFFWLTTLQVDSAYLTGLLPPLVVTALGMGLVFVPVTLIATSGVPDEDQGLASGVFNTSQQIGGALGLAILSSLAVTATTTALHDAPAASRTSLGQQQALLDGFHVAFIGCGVAGIIAFLVLAIALRHRHVAHIATDEPVTVGV